MNTPRNPAAPSRPHHPRLSAGVAAFALTIMASGSHAVTIPNVPLEAGAQFPPPNVMFILDDSGSMEETTMYTKVSNVSPVNIRDQAAVRNTLYYNPSVTYESWIKADGSRYTQGRSYTAALSDLVRVTTSTVNLSNSIQTFYVPMVGATDLGNTDSYYRYDIRPGSDGLMRTNDVSIPTGYPVADLDANSGFQLTTSFRVPNGTGVLVVRTSGGTHGDNGDANNGRGNGPDLYIRSGSNPTTSNFSCASTGGDNNERCTIFNPTAGNWFVGLNAASRYRDVDVFVEFWANPSTTLPIASRNLDGEKANFATWYSYHRSRMKTAKAGASEAFYGLPEDLRIGYTNIHGDSGSSFNIPVDSDGGLFRDTGSSSNKSNWFAKLHDENTSSPSFTPLRTGLINVGEYFKDDSADGPWGPETGDDQLACRQNFAILTTDGYWNKQDEDEASSETQAVLASIGNEDGTSGPNGYVATSPYADDHSGTLADVAMHYWKNDLRTDLDNKVPTSAADRASWQHMSTFGISIGLEGNIVPRTPRTTRGGTSGWTSPDPGTGTGNIHGIDDLWHASVNGRGSFVVANNAKEFQRGLLDAFTLVAERTGSASNVTANSTSFTSDTRIFQATYVSGRWSGDLISYAATSAGLGGTSWSAASKIGTGTRNFFTWDSVRNRGAAFPLASQTLALNQLTRTIAPVSGADNVAYIMGTRTLERGNTGGTLRTRTSALGDIVNSSPAYSKDTNTIYVGANDGMLHAFDATSGVELFAFVPASINFADLATLSSPSYAHRYFVDGPIGVTSRDLTDGKNYLVGSLGRGGKALFGLDVTNPAAFATRDVLWEVRDSNLGNVLGEPLLTRINDDDKTVAIVGNGLNSAGGSAVLFVIDVATGAVLHEIDTGATGDNGLFDPRGFDVDRNQTVDYVYAGDYRGNLWKFDFTGATPSVALGGEPLITTSSGQPITSGIALAKDPDTNKRWVFFGTGSYLTSADLTDTTVQSVYGVIDDDAVVDLDDLVDRDIIVVTTTEPGPDGIFYEVRGFEPLAPLAASEKGWKLDLDDPSPGERVINRPQIRDKVMVFSSRIPPADDTGCDAGGEGYINALSPFSGNSTENPYFEIDVNGDDIFDPEEDRLDDPRDDGDVTVPVGSIKPRIGMPTQCVIIDGLLVCGGSLGNIETLPISPPTGEPRRASWQEILGD